MKIQGFWRHKKPGSVLGCNPLCFKMFSLHNSLEVSRLKVVSREAKKGQSDRQKQNARRTTVCLLHKWTFSSFDVIITVNISRATSTFKPALKTHNLLANINQHPKDKSNRLSSLAFPAWSKSMNFAFTFFFSLTEVASSPF